MRYFVVSEKLSNQEDNWFTLIKKMETEVRSGGKMTSVDFLVTYIKNGCNVNAENDIGDTALTLGYGWAPIHFYSVLLKYGADPNHLCSSGMAPLNYFISANDITTFKLFLASGANPDIKEKDGLFPLKKASQLMRRDFVKELLKYKVNINNKDNMNSTALHEAALNDDLPIVVLLLGYGANALMRDKNNQIPRDLTTNDAIKQVLKKYEEHYLRASDENEEI